MEECVTEDEYIMCGDLKTLTHAITILNDIIPENSKIIGEEYYSIRFQLREWQRLHFEKIKIEKL